jgi:mevalonate kinase
MVQKISDIFYGKIILFGEYGIIFDSMALTIPFTHFHGELSFNNRFNKYKYTDFDFANNSNVQLEAYTAYLRRLHDQGELEMEFNFNALIRDLDNGLYFESTIPQGFGLGSSGALVAALYNKYAVNKIQGGRSVSKEKTLRLKKIFSQMESFFHGKSSGIDPLNSYIQFPLLIKSKTEIETVGIPRNKIDGDSAIFLVNTGKPGKTEPVVNLFLEKCKDPNYFGIITNKFIPLNNSCIGNLIAGDLNPFFENLHMLSDLQFHYFREMIPADFLSVWEKGLEGDDFKIKLCGSGGGGYLLGFTRNLPRAHEFFAAQHMDFVTVYKSTKE